MRTEFRIDGYLVGKIWMPATECYKPLDYTFVRKENERRSPWQDAHETLRDALLQITNDGDFQSCGVADGMLTVTRQDGSGGRKRSYSRCFPLDSFPSISDMICADWAGPNCEDE